jgi:hypothetical protein
MSESLKLSFESETTPQQRGLCRFVYLLILTTAAGLSATSLAKVEPLLSANDRSRWCTIWSLVERGTYQIDEIIRQPGWDTIDKVRHEEHFYSSKPALLPTVVAGVYWSVKKVTGWNLLDDTKRVTRFTLFLVNFIPWMAALVLIVFVAERYARTDVARIYIVIVAAWGTLLTTFLVTLNNHTVAAASVVFAIYPAMRILADNAHRPLLFGLAGFFAAFTCCAELPAALFGLALFALLFRKAPHSTLKFFVPAALIPLVAFFATNYLATGGWKPFYFDFGKVDSVYEYSDRGRPSYWMNPQGIDANTEHPLVYLLHCTIGHHGILSLSPVFLLTILAWVKIRSWRQFPLRPFLWLGLGLTVAILGFYLTRTGNYNYGGHTSGLRWMFWLIPFWLISMIPILDEWGHRRWFQFTAAGLLLISIFSATYSLDNPWRHPWLFQLMEKQGWIDYSNPENPPTSLPL